MLAIVEYGHIWAGQAAVGSKTRTLPGSAIFVGLLRCGGGPMRAPVLGVAAAGRLRTQRRRSTSQQCPIGAGGSSGATRSSLTLCAVVGQMPGSGGRTPGALGWACSLAVRSAAAGAAMRSPVEARRYER